MISRLDSIHEADPGISVQPRPPLPNVERDFQLAKRYLQKYGDENETLWTHLIEVIHKILIGKKELTPRELHVLCRRLRERKLRVGDWMVDLYQRKLYLDRSIDLIELFVKPKYQWNWEDRIPETNKLLDEKFISKMRMERAISFSIPEKDIYSIMMAMRVLGDNIKVAKITFWGKIFGIFRDYYIVECDVDPEELERMHAEELAKIEEAKRKEEEEQKELERLENEEKERLAKEEKIKKEREKREKKKAKRKEKERKKQEQIEKMERIKKRRMEIAKRMGMDIGEVGEDMLLAELEGEGRRKKKKIPEPEVPIIEEPPPPESLFDKYIMPKLPIFTIKPKVEVPSEPYGEGLNKKEYYVCNLPGEPWIRLPDVTPQQIVISRRIKKFLSGDLNAEVISMPTFPGKEKNYLRAMIARISCSTQVSPVGYYIGGGGAEGFGEEGPAGTEASLNPEFPGVPWTKLFNKSQTLWAHHSPYILPQGRLTWWKPPRTDDQVGEGGEGVDNVKPEIGPPILRTIARDTSDDVKPWSLIPSSIVMRTGVAIMARSNLWPGATSTALEFNFQYLYIGWGIKFCQYGYSPPFLPVPAVEYEIGPEIIEMLDPTPEEEEAWRIAHMPKEKKKGVGEGGEGEGVEGVEDDDDQEDDDEEEE